MKTKRGSSRCVGLSVTNGLAGAAVASLAAALAVLAVGATQPDSSMGCAWAGEAVEVSASEAKYAVVQTEADQKAQEDMDADLAAAVEAYSKAVPQENGTCYTCHTDEAMLEASLSDSDDAVTKYLVDPDYVTTTHGLLGCTYCHGGHPGEADASKAMADMNSRPTSDGGVSVCGTCHTQVVENYATSLHNTTKGLYNAWDERLSLASENMGVNLVDMYYHHDGYSGACYDCHATCGTCHVTSVQGAPGQVTGLTAGHNFVDSTSNDEIANSCLSCHAGSITGCWTNYDVHGPTGAGLSCMDCHNATELHGDGNAYETMSHSGAITTECTDCHNADDLTGEWHSQTHLTSAECWACHTSDYNTCNNCHGWNAASRNEGDQFAVTHDDTYLGYDVTNGKVTTLVHAPVDTGMLGDASDLMLNEEDLNTRSSWWIGFTHGVIVPELNQEFCNRCHGEGAALLKEEDLQFPDWETEQMVGSLPEVDVENYK